jgi:hypothetical protein
MILNVAKWRDNAIAPVVFMIDDIANVSVKNSKSESLQIGEDWGQYGRDKNSMWDFLSKNLLEKFPHIKTTFFLVTDKRSPMALGEEYSYAQRIDRDRKFMDFLLYLEREPNIELAYHGTTHGEAFDKHEEFLQEWETFKSLNTAVSEINRGQELFKKVLGVYANGGKYCGYEAGKFGDDSISKTGFKWWCYHWDGVIWDRGVQDSKYSYDLSLNQGVVDIPSTVDGSTLSLKLVKKIFTRKYLKSLYLYFVERKRIEKHINSLYMRGDVISIQEHASPYRTDGRIQYPNIVSDIDNLNYIFNFLDKKDVWYVTCTELADYYLARLNVKINTTKNGEFQLLSNHDLTTALTLTTPFMQKKLSLCDSKGRYLLTFEHKRDTLYVTYLFERDKIYRIIELN